MEAKYGLVLVLQHQPLQSTAEFLHIYILHIYYVPINTPPIGAGCRSTSTGKSTSHHLQSQFQMLSGRQRKLSENVSDHLGCLTPNHSHLLLSNALTNEMILDINVLRLVGGAHVHCQENTTFVIH